MKKLLITLCVAVMLLCISLTGYAAYLGDVNGDGKVTAADARLALRMSASLEELKDTHTHDYTATEIQKQSCEKDGIIEYRCSGCDHTYRNVTKATGHEYVSTVIKQVTCIESGEEILKCKNCEHSYPKILEAYGHNFINGTCYSVGYCSRCKIKDESTTPTGHNIDPKTFKCSVCNRVLKSPVSFIPDSVDAEIAELRFWGYIGDPDTFALTKVFYCVGPFSGEPDVAYFVRMEYSYRSPRNVYKTGIRDICIYEYSNVLYTTNYGYNSDRNIQLGNKTKYYINVDEIAL